MDLYTKKIKNVVKQSGKKGVGINELAKQLKAKGSHMSEYMEAVDALKDSGVIMLRKQKLVYTENFGCIPAVISRINKTFGFARSSLDNEEYFIPGKFLMGTLPGDKVLIKKLGKQFARETTSKSSPEAEVVSIIAFNASEFTGKLLEYNGNFAILPDNLVKTPIPVKKTELNGAVDGDKVLARIVKHGDRHGDHRAEIISAYGDADTAASCAQAILDLNGITDEFPLEVVDQARYLEKRGIKSKEFEGRTDFRNEIIFTIDGADSKDLDDAISINKYEDCYELGVHIADVSHYVLYQSDIDREAYTRGTSIYYANKVVPMLPRELSNGICSLNPCEDRLAFSVLITLDLEGNMIDFNFQKSMIRSRVKGVYSEVNAIYDGTASDSVLKKYKMVLDRLSTMRELAQLRLLRKQERGAPVLVTNESKIIVDDNGLAVDIRKRTSGESESMIEEFMLLANEAAAMAGKLKDIPFLYRVHESPTPEKLENLNLTLRLLGLQKRDLSPNVKPKALAEILEKSKGSDVESIVNMQVLRAMSKAKYSETPIGHYGLALENYAHFTSPIRRYPDLQVHRVLSGLLEGTNPKTLRRKYGKFNDKAAVQSSQTEMQAVKIERDCEDCYKAEYMKQFLGEEFDGIIASAARQGIYVELPNTIEGLVRAEDLPGQGYQFDGVMQFKSKLTGQSFRVGNKVRVRCVKCNVNSGNIDFQLV